MVLKVFDVGRELSCSSPPSLPVYYYLLSSPALREYVRLFQLVGCQFPVGAALLVKV